MMIAWYQPREVMTQKRLVHLCPDNPKTTLCGLKINYNWILWDGDGTLEFHFTDGSRLVNDDCKKDYTWEYY